MDSMSSINILNVDSYNEKTFDELVHYLKNNKVSENDWKGVIDKVSNNYKHFIILFNTFDEMRSKKYKEELLKAVNNSAFIISEINEDNGDLICSFIKNVDKNSFFMWDDVRDYFNSHNLIGQLADFVAKKDVNGDAAYQDIYGILIMWCLKIKYLIKPNSPDFFKREYILVVPALRNRTISLDDLGLDNFDSFPVGSMIKLLNISISNCENIDEYKKLINEKLKDTIKVNDNEVVCNNFNDLSSYDDYYNTIVSYIPNGPYNIYLTNNYYFRVGDPTAFISNSIDFFDISSINKFIKAIKKSKKDLKLYFTISKEEMKTSFLEQIIDLNMVVFYSLDRKNKYTGYDILKFNKILDLFVLDIKKSSLSPYEKYISVYNIVKSFKKYLQNEFDNGFDDQSRSIYLLLYNYYMVCVGYANLLHSLLNRVGIDSTSYKWSSGNHRLNYVKIEDPKYGINGFFKSDPTQDNEIDDPINKGYYFLNRNILEDTIYITPFDEYLRKDEDYIEKMTSGMIDELFNYVVQIEPDVKDTDKLTALKMFRQKYKNQKEKEVCYDKTISAIIAVKEFIKGEKFDDNDKFDEIIHILNSSPYLRCIRYYDFYKMKQSSLKKAFAILLQMYIRDFNKKLLDNIKILMISDHIVLFCQGLSESEINNYSQFFSKKGIEIYVLDNNMGLDLTDELQEELIDGSMFEKISLYVEMFNQKKL